MNGWDQPYLPYFMIEVRSVSWAIYSVPLKQPVKNNFKKPSLLPVWGAALRRKVSFLAPKLSDSLIKISSSAGKVHHPDALHPYWEQRASHGHRTHRLWRKERFQLFGYPNTWLQLFTPQSFIIFLFNHQSHHFLSLRTCRGPKQVGVSEGTIQGFNSRSIIQFHFQQVSVVRFIVTSDAFHWCRIGWLTLQCHL